jgi:hypothetical protein
MATELLGRLVGSSVHATCAVWTHFAGFPTCSATVDVGQTAEDPSQQAQPAADATEPGPGPDTHESATAHGETGAASAALTEPLSTDQVSTEQQSNDQPSIDRTTTGAGSVTGRVDVTFRVPAAVGAHSAHVCGEFNDWSTTADPMNRLDDGGFELVRAVPVGRRWRFRYLLDGNRWENDWAADDYMSNAFGDHDSVVDLQTPSTSRLVSRNRLAGE